MKTIHLLMIAVSVAGTPIRVHATDTDSLGSGQTLHRIEVEAMPDLILHTNDFLRGENERRRHMNSINTYSIKYAFQAPEQSGQARIYGSPYQGVGVATHLVNDLLGTPFSVYLFQGARIARLSSQAALNYEWKFGLTTGWETYDYELRHDNLLFGSTTTAFMNLGFYVNYRLSAHVDLNAGFSASHFSNGNTSYPNAGLNAVGPRVSLSYYFNRHDDTGAAASAAAASVSPLERRLFYDLMAYGAWCKGGYKSADGTIAAPGSFGVCGFNFAPMYQLGYLFSAGLSLDGVYDRSANLEAKVNDAMAGDVSYDGHDQFAMGLSVRGELSMPYFAVNVGIGTNFINGKGDLGGVYEMLALKVGLADRVYLNIGYTLHDFKDPDHLMFGLGYRFGSKHRSAPTLF